MPRFLSAAWVVMCLVAPAAACPYCNSEVGKEVFAGIFNRDFGNNLLLTLLPLLLLLLIVLLIHFGLPWPKSRLR